jgi:hypothetical protein
MDAGNWIALLLGVGTLMLGAVNSYVQWPHKTGDTPQPTSHRSLILMAMLSAVVVGAVSYDIYDRHHQLHRENVPSWGGIGENYHMIVATHELQDQTKTMRLMLIVRPSLLGADPMADTNIGKSGSFTISGASVALAVPANTPLRMVPNQLNVLEYDAVLLPLGIGPDRVRTLADVIDLGGKIFETRGTSVMAGPPLDAAAASPK